MPYQHACLWIKDPQHENVKKKTHEKIALCPQMIFDKPLNTRRYANTTICSSTWTFVIFRTQYRSCEYDENNPQYFWFLRAALMISWIHSWEACGQVTIFKAALVFYQRVGVMILYTYIITMNITPVTLADQAVIHVSFTTVFIFHNTFMLSKMSSEQL